MEFLAAKAAFFDGFVARLKSCPDTNPPQQRWRVAHPFVLDLFNAINTKGVPFFAHFAKGGSLIALALLALDFPRSTAGMLPQGLKPNLLGGLRHD